MILDKTLMALLVTITFGFLMGLEVRNYRENFSSNFSFGSIRTYTFAALMGFVFFLISPIAYITAFIILAVFAIIFYYLKLKEQTEVKESIVIFMVLFIVYSFGPLALKEPLWLIGSIFVILIFGLNVKKFYPIISEKIDINEVEIFAKIILLSIVILPLLPKKALPYIELSPFKIWLIVVIISIISYIGYLLQKYVFSNKGYYFTGLAGGAYSSTATTVVLASKAISGCLHSITAGIIGATAIMYIRLIIIAYVFNSSIGDRLLIPFLGLALSAIVISLFYLQKEVNPQKSEFVDKNPLELKTAFIFAGLFVFMIFITKFIHTHFGNSGLAILSFIVGFTDIDPFILSILTGKMGITVGLSTKLIFIATASNNFLKSFYSFFFSKNKCKTAGIWIFILGVVTLGLAFIPIFSI